MGVGKVQELLLFCIALMYKRIQAGKLEDRQVSVLERSVYSRDDEAVVKRRSAGYYM